MFSVPQQRAEKTKKAVTFKDQLTMSVPQNAKTSEICLPLSAERDYD